ncbi:hypothetical protein D9V86_11565 [Bacteroidetes/Chlorobi group bacterium ChocPot_Mid]|jgi:hypothetical protein|nr:MAG: hypothetical protein D9V86_11565 [Bacteroidetes/Chlorobi group bacterium ChocPot_Mid]
MKILFSIIFLFLLLNLKGRADENLLDELDSISEPKVEYETSAFKTTRIVSGHSIQSMKEGELEFRISHRFGSVNSGVDGFWGLDQSTIFLSLEYGITDWLELGIGRTSNEKTVHGFAKIGLLKQSKGEVNIPVSLSYFASAGINTMSWNDPKRENFFTSRLSFTHQLLIARKFNEYFSLQLTPTLIHLNLVPTALDDNDIFALGIGGRYKITNRVSLNMEYFYVARPTWNIENDFVNPLSIGVDIETGGHVFQIMLSNSLGMIEKHYIADNTGSWSKGDIHLGFNISRVFTLY